MKIDYSKQEYIVSNRTGFTLSEALSLWKAKYADFKDLKKDMITHESLQDFGNFIEEMWTSIKPTTVQEALAKENAEERRVYFDCIGVQRLFQELEPTLRDRQVIKKKRTKWDDNNDPYQYEFEDVYELYEIDGKKLYDKDRWGNDPQPIFAVRCWCTTTNREYWLYVPREAALGRNWWIGGDGPENKPDAIRAIAWTVRIDVHPEDVDKIYRQGDIIVAKMKDSAKLTQSTFSPYHLDKEQYLSLMYSET
jgi:hypothetical protein